MWYNVDFKLETERIFFGAGLVHVHLNFPLFYMAKMIWITKIVNKNQYLTFLANLPCQHDHLTQSLPKSGGEACNVPFSGKNLGSVVQCPKLFTDNVMILTLFPQGFKQQKETWLGVIEES